jgi:hypothetical protein
VCKGFVNLPVSREVACRLTGSRRGWRYSFVHREGLRVEGSPTCRADGDRAASGARGHGSADEVQVEHRERRADPVEADPGCVDEVVAVDQYR